MKFMTKYTPPNGTPFSNGTPFGGLEFPPKFKKFASVFGGFDDALNANEHNVLYQ